jgi:Na+-driven multidrug efflux pump
MKTTEHTPLLVRDATIHVLPQDAHGEDNDAIAREVSNSTELKELLALAYPVVLTTALEFLPGFTSTIQAGHLPSISTKEYVDAATMSLMVRPCYSS